MADDQFRYSSGFGNEFASEAVAGALPEGRNSPQRAPLGLYAEQLSGTAFTQPRAREPADLGVPDPAVGPHPAFPRIGNGTLRGTPFDEIEPDPNRLRWDPLPLPGVGRAEGGPGAEGRATSSTASTRSCGNGDIRTRSGMAVHRYAANRAMTDRYFIDSDGELLFVPEPAPSSCTPSSARCGSAPARSPWSRAASGSG